MARVERFSFSHTRKVDGAYRYVSQAAEAGVVMNTGNYVDGRQVMVDGQRLLNFGSCSYMGLENLPELREGVLRALDQYGTQFHFSRAYLQCELYVELESLLEQIAGRPVVVAASTSLGHMAALPVLIKDTDHIVIDQFAHASLHNATHLVPGVPLEVLRHNRMDRLDDFLTRTHPKGGNVWYICDGLYSMLGDFAPFEQLAALLDKHDHLRVYIDDAHSTSWTGTAGRGVALEHFAKDERVFVALSLNKAFSAAGGAIAVPNREWVARLRRCGGPMLFSGPIQPPMLGAAVGSARLHLSPKFAQLQAELDERLHLCKRSSSEHPLELSTEDLSPIFQAQCDSPRIAFAVADLMKARGYFCCVCVFPAVPMNRPGLRFTVTRHNQPEEILGFLATLTSSIEDVRKELGRSLLPEADELRIAN